MLIREAEPEQQKGLDQDEQHPHHAAKGREGIFFEDRKGQKIERDEKGGYSDNRLTECRLIRIDAGKQYQGSIGECQHEQGEDHATAGKVPAEDEPKYEDNIRQGCDRLLQPHWESLGTKKSNRYEKNYPARKENREDGFPELVNHGSYLCLEWSGDF